MLTLSKFIDLNQHSSFVLEFPCNLLKNGRNMRHLYLEGNRRHWWQLTTLILSFFPYLDFLVEFPLSVFLSLAMTPVQRDDEGGPPAAFKYGTVRTWTRTYPLMRLKCRVKNVTIKLFKPNASLKFWQIFFFWSPINQMCLYCLCWFL